MTCACLRQRWLIGSLVLAVSLLAGGGAVAAPQVKTQPAKTSATPKEKLDPKGKHGIPAPAPDYGVSQIKLINEQIRQGWQAHELSPSPTATDGEWCRRLFLDLLGRVPTIAELNKFLGSKAPNRKLELVNALLSEEYVEDYANNWTTLWTNILIGRTGGTGRRTLVSRPGLQYSLRRAFQKDLPYDRMVYELISAEGMSKRGETGFNGFVNYLAGHLADNGIEATARTAQIFLGIQVRCTQCHNHPFNDYKQNQFWEMNAFFRQTKLTQHMGDTTVNGKKRRELNYIELKNQDFAGEDKNASEALLFYELRNGKLASALPVFVDGTPLSSQRPGQGRRSPQRAGPARHAFRPVGQDDRQPHVGAFPRLRLHQAGRRHGPPQSAHASRTARSVGR